MPSTPPAEQAVVVRRGIVVSPKQESLAGSLHRPTPIPADDERDDSAYRSDQVVLPSTVPELIRAYEAAYRSNQCLQRLLAHAGTEETASPASTSPIAATGPIRATTVPATGSSSNPATAASAVAAAPTAPVAGVVKGRVLTGSTGPKEDPATARASLSSEQIQRLLRDIAESGDQQRRSEVDVLTSRVKALQSENDTLRAAVTTPDGSDGPTGPADTAQVASLASALAEAQRAKQHADALRYERAQLRTQLTDSNKKRALLEEATRQLEGQIQRLLTSSVALMGGDPPETRRSPPPVTTDATTTATSATHTPHKAGSAPTDRTGASHLNNNNASSPAATATATAPAANTSQTRNTGQIAALEKQIDHLRGTVDKLQASVDAGEQRRTKLEAALRKSRQEHAAAKESLLQYRRQVNESEIAAETDATDKDSEARARALEKECIRLRAAFAERRERFTTDLAASSHVCEGLKQELAVYARAVPRLMRQVARLQIASVIRTQTAATAAGAKDGAVPSCATSPLAPPAAQTHSGAEPTTAPAVSAPSVDATANDRTGPAAPAPITANVSEPRTPFTSEPDASATMRTLTDDQQALLREIKSTYERRLDSLQSHMRAETKHLQSLNKELRVALAASQEEARLGARQLTRLRESDASAERQRQPTPTLLAVDSALNMISPERSGIVFSRTQSFDTSPLPSAVRQLERGGDASRALSEAELRYDPEHMPTWEAVQIENEALLARLSLMQEDKWRLSSQVEDLRGRCTALERAHQQQHASRAEQLLNTLRAQPTTGQRGGDDARLRSLQALLQETLQENMVLQDEMDKLKSHFGRAPA